MKHKLREREVLRIHDLAVLQYDTRNCSTEGDGVVVCTEAGGLITEERKREEGQGERGGHQAPSLPKKNLQGQPIRC